MWGSGPSANESRPAREASPQWHRLWLNPRAAQRVGLWVRSLRADVCIASHSSGVTSSVTCRAAHPVRHLPRTPEAVPQWRARRFGVREAMVSGPCRAIVREQEPLKRQPALQLLRDHFHRTVVQLHAAPSACMCVVRARGRPCASADDAACVYTCKARRAKGRGFMHPCLAGLRTRAITGCPSPVRTLGITACTA